MNGFSIVVRSTLNQMGNQYLIRFYIVRAFEKDKKKKKANKFNDIQLECLAMPFLRIRYFVSCCELVSFLRAHHCHFFLPPSSFCLFVAIVSRKYEPFTQSLCQWPSPFELNHFYVSIFVVARFVHCIVSHSFRSILIFNFCLSSNLYTNPIFTL